LLLLRLLLLWLPLWCDNKGDDEDDDGDEYRLVLLLLLLRDGDGDDDEMETILYQSALVFIEQTLSRKLENQQHQSLCYRSLSIYFKTHFKDICPT
jgi:hypothetical protein